MPQPLSGPGIGLPLPQSLYPTQLQNAPADISSNFLTLAPGDAIPVPAGKWFISLDGVCVLQFLDPVTGVWRGFESGRGGYYNVKSDGFTMRIANMTGCPIAAIVTGGGTGYSQATATITASAGGSTWQPIVGGQLSIVTVGVSGSGYGLAPLVFIPPPPNPGVQATASATLSAGTVASVTLTNVGAGYKTVPAAVILPNPTDPNLGVSAITQATVTFGLVNATAITAALCTNNGAAQSNATAPTLTPAGAGGSGATISAVMMSTLTGISVAGGGFGYGANSVLQTFGGAPTVTPAYTNPAIELNTYRPRNASAGLTVTAGSITALGTIYDSGLFAGVPLDVIATQGAPTSTAANISLTIGGANGTVFLQPAP